jgi:serine protease Do
MKKYLQAVSAALLLTGSVSYSQSNDIQQNDNKNEQKVITSKQKSNDDKKKLKEYDEIIIKRKEPTRDTKVTIEIKNDEIIVDGKPLDEFVDDEVSVQLRDVNKFHLYGPSSQFRMNGGDWKMYADGEERAFLGVATEDSDGGAKIVSITENSGAAKAGLKKGDIITRVNDKPIEDHGELSEIIGDLKPEDKVTITYKRDGKENKTTATLGKMAMPIPPVPPMAPDAPGPPMGFNFDQKDFGDMMQMHRFGDRPRIGIKAQDTEEGKGVKVLGVDDGSPADKAGIKENDIITSFEGKDVNSVGELGKASREAKEKSSVKVQVQRNGKPQTIEIKIPKKLKTADL